MNKFGKPSEPWGRCGIKNLKVISVYLEAVILLSILIIPHCTRLSYRSIISECLVLPFSVGNRNVKNNLHFWPTIQQIENF